MEEAAVLDDFPEAPATTVQSITPRIVSSVSPSWKLWASYQSPSAEPKAWIQVLPFPSPMMAPRAEPPLWTF
jgi:hypothetical protein